MEKEKIQEFTRKITESNRSELIVILFEMSHTYLSDAKAALAENKIECFREQIRNADRVVANLQQSLNYKYEIAGNLGSLYAYCRTQLARSLMKNDTVGMEEADRILCRLQKSFEQVAATDHSAPLMKNTSKVYAGMTYGRNDVVESYQDGMDAKRGFFV